MSAYDVKRGGMHLSEAPGVPPVVCVPASELRTLRAHSRVLMRILREPGWMSASETTSVSGLVDLELERPEPGPVPPYSTE